MELKDLRPKHLWENFSRLNAIPRASKKEARVIAFIEDFGKSLGLETHRDAVGNVMIRKPASPGMENRQTVILQSHLDMVHQKNSDSVFDFDTQGIDMYVDGDWVKARGTTLGADNGIGVATIMSILADKAAVHPQLEAMFTIDEETGMTGAKQLDASQFTGTILLNLDTEEEEELTIGCAGGLDTNTSATYNQVAPAADIVSFAITVRGLMGGHSGMDINKGRANANKLMNRFLFKASDAFGIQLASLEGGSLRNAIPRESTALLAVSASEAPAFTAFVKSFGEVMREEYKSIEPGFKMECKPAANPALVMEASFFRKMLRAVYAAPNGVFRMSPDIPGLVEASTNLAKVVVKEGSFITQSLQRSSVDSTKEDVANAVSAAFENMGCEVEQSGEYPGWKPDADSAILKQMLALYKDHFPHTPKVGAVHAGLECGILGAHFNGKLDMISFGPTIHGAHSPDETVQISSVERFYNYLLHILREIPVK
ncbi:aminoacyl-histidine dipeptidase [Chitinophaga sp. 212800010-3]|uniref:aminoacyl-histidine dipeptidase n=1 Tax=unclassified Chitinophaga TaxID=2619133 RepID=UPI002DE70015|nr:Xaa-His dipeptidase [Chitinophaga sp. 212800010-3]